MARTRKPLWKTAATPEEVRKVADLDPKIAKVRTHLRRLTASRQLIMQRCATRSWRHRH